MFSLDTLQNFDKLKNQNVHKKAGIFLLYQGAKTHFQ